MNPAQDLLRHLTGQNEGSSARRNHEPSFWLRARVIDIKTKLAAGEARTCEHALTTPILLAPLWDHGYIACAHCMPDLNVNEDFTCDRCRRHSHDLKASMLDIDTDVVVMFGLCPDCQQKESPAA